MIAEGNGDGKCTKGREWWKWFTHLGIELVREHPLREVERLAVGGDTPNLLARIRLSTRLTCAPAETLLGSGGGSSLVHA